uniref:SCP domain-containing protein n=1 Tax=Steinernema glaseri TaxID=37863 RepID=A0A1I8ADG5_9BILA
MLALANHFVKCPFCKENALNNDGYEALTLFAMHLKVGLLVFAALLCGALAVLPDNNTVKDASKFKYSFAQNNSLPADNAASVCYDRKIGAFIDTALSYYSHNMDQLTKYILDQIVRARYSGQYLVHAQMINQWTQGVQWQSTTNGDIFTGKSRTGCYYHDTQTYILVVKY